MHREAQTNTGTQTKKHPVACSIVLLVGEEWGDAEVAKDAKLFTPQGAANILWALATLDASMTESEAESAESKARGLGCYVAMGRLHKGIPKLRRRGSKFRGAN